MDVLQRPFWNGTPVDLGETWRLRKSDCDGQREAVCRLFSHQLGWELRVEVGSELRRSQVCKTEAEVFETYETWKAVMLEKGWR